MAMLSRARLVVAVVGSSSRCRAIAGFVRPWRRRSRAKLAHAQSAAAPVTSTRYPPAKCSALTHTRRCSAGRRLTRHASAWGTTSMRPYKDHTMQPSPTVLNWW